MYSLTIMYALFHIFDDNSPILQLCNQLQTSLCMLSGQCKPKLKNTAGLLREKN